MSTIKTWQERVQHCAEESYQGYVSPAEVDSYKEAEITELREALKAAQEALDCNIAILAARTASMNRFMQERDALQAKLSAIEAQEPVATKLETQQFSCFHVSFYDSERLKALPVGTKLYAAPVAPAQPLTKEQDADVEYWRKKYQALDKLYDELEKEKEAIEQNYRAIT